MSAARSLWRAVAAMLRIAALVAVAMPSPGHAHAGVAERGAAYVHAAHVQSAAADGQAIGHAVHHDHCLGNLDQPDRHDGSKSHGPCSCMCGCQSALTGAAVPALPIRRGRPAALRPPDERPFSTLTLELRPRPPRTFV